MAAKIKADIQGKPGLQLVAKDDFKQVWLQFPYGSICINNIANEMREGIIKRAFIDGIIKYLEQEKSNLCKTCGGHGAVGNILNAEPCPECSTVEQETCEYAPEGWRCTRAAGHVGPCAAEQVVRSERPAAETPSGPVTWMPADEQRLDTALTGFFGKPAVTVDSTEFDSLLDKYSDSDISDYKEVRASLIAHIDAWAAADKARAMAQLKRQNLEFSRINEEQRLQENRLETALFRERALAKLLQAQAALSDEQIDTLAEKYVFEPDETLFAPLLRNFARAIIAAGKQPAATPTREQSEQRQRERMAEKFANRATGPATADFDFPAPNDAPAIQQEVAALDERARMKVEHEKAYPEPDSPHLSVKERAALTRAAYERGFMDRAALAAPVQPAAQ